MYMEQNQLYTKYNYLPTDFDEPLDDFKNYIS